MYKSWHLANAISATHPVDWNLELMWLAIWYVLLNSFRSRIVFLSSSSVWPITASGIFFCRKRYAYCQSCETFSTLKLSFKKAKPRKNRVFAFATLCLFQFHFNRRCLKYYLMVFIKISKINCIFFTYIFLVFLAASKLVSRCCTFCLCSIFSFKFFFSACQKCYLFMSLQLFLSRIVSRISFSGAFCISCHKNWDPLSKEILKANYWTSRSLGVFMVR